MGYRVRVRGGREAHVACSIMDVSYWATAPGYRACWALRRGRFYWVSWNQYVVHMREVTSVRKNVAMLGPPMDKYVGNGWQWSR